MNLGLADGELVAATYSCLTMAQRRPLPTFSSSPTEYVCSNIGECLCLMTPCPLNSGPFEVGDEGSRYDRMYIPIHTSYLHTYLITCQDARDGGVWRADGGRVAHK